MFLTCYLPDCCGFFLTIQSCFSDLDGNGVWDFDEVKALFLKELDKMYQAGAPEDDMRERMEEMERMREHVFQEADTNRDGLISYEEFHAQTQKKDFNSDPGWESLDQQQVYTPEEYHKFELQRQHEIEAMIADGRVSGTRFIISKAKNPIFL